MNLRDIKYILAVADTRHFGRAADRCFVSQPTLSGQIKKLEEELGVTLFERTNRSVDITPIGEAILAPCPPGCRNRPMPSNRSPAPIRTPWTAPCASAPSRPSAPI